VDREDLYSIQTPQIFNLKIFEEAVSNAIENNLDFTDDCQLLENVNKDIYIVASDSLNIKITTPEDLLIANAIIGGI
jgi:2-C-methyl-D-erythritol 4-phosphate cytidylyltransferase